MIRNAPSIGIGLGLSLRNYGSGGFSPEAQNYFDRLDAAGDVTYTPYKQPLANYIDSLVALGGAYWDNMLSAASFVGVGIQGITVPLRDGMPVLTNNNFVDADLSQTTGAKSDGIAKYMSTNTLTSSLGQNDHSLSVYLTEGRDGSTGRYISGATANLTVLGNTISAFRARSASTALYTLGASTATGELIGISRDNSANFDWQYETSGNQVDASIPIIASNINVFADGAGGNKTAARLATYHVGPALDLSVLSGLQDTLITQIAAV